MVCKNFSLNKRWTTSINVFIFPCSFIMCSKCVDWFSERRFKTRTWVWIWFYHLCPIGPWVSYLISFHLCFLIGKMRLLIIYLRELRLLSILSTTWKAHSTWYITRALDSSYCFYVFFIIIIIIGTRALWLNRVPPVNENSAFECGHINQICFLLRCD